MVLHKNQIPSNLSYDHDDGEVIIEMDSRDLCLVTGLWYSWL